MLLSHFVDEEPEVREGVRLSQSCAAWSRASNAGLPDVTAVPYSGAHHGGRGGGTD